MSRTSDNGGVHKVSYDPPAGPGQGERCPVCRGMVRLLDEGRALQRLEGRREEVRAAQEGVGRLLPLVELVGDLMSFDCPWQGACPYRRG